MGNMSKRRQPDKRVEHRGMTPIGLQHSEKIMQTEEGLSWPLNKNVY